MAEGEVRTLDIVALGHRGDGVARGAIHVPFALPGERVSAFLDGDRARLVEILTPAPERAAPICRYFADCGGCAAQHMSAALYAEWKRGIVARALRLAGVEAEVGLLIDAHGEGRRRATFHARFNGEDAAVGYMRARAHKIVAIDSCPILAPSMAKALPSARDIANRMAKLGKPLDIAITATLGGLDVDIRGAGAPDAALRAALIGASERLDLARLSNHGEILVERRAPKIAMGASEVTPPPGGFLQATAEAERLIAALADKALAGGRIADLFCGVGAFALRLAERRAIHAVDADGGALAALQRAAGETLRLRPISREERDLFQRPLTRQELKRVNAVLFDPPRAGAAAQTAEIAASGVPSVVAVSCNPATFARDARILVDGGYRLVSVAPIDQFRFSPHVEIVGAFSRAKAAKRAKRILG